MTTVKLSKERIKAEKHDFSSEELFSLLQKYFFEFKKAHGLYLSKYYSRCAVKKVQTIRLNAKSGHQTVIDDFFDKIGEFRCCGNEFYTFSPQDITQEVANLKQSLGI